MANEKSNMEEFIINEDSFGRIDRYEIVDKFPDGYVVWNIGRLNFDHPCFVPLAKPDPEREYGILRTGLKALKVESEELAKFVMNEAIKGPYMPNKTWFDETVNNSKL